MKKALFIISLILTCSSALFAQTATGRFTVKGCVTDSLTKAGEAYATLRIADAASPDKPVAMTLTKSDGSFTAKLPSGRNYVLTVSAVGRKVVVRNFKAPATDATVDLGQLLISDGGNHLKGVEVVAQKPLVKSDIDKLSYNIEEDPDSKTSTVIDMLRKVPLVTVDGQDNIKVNGNSGFKVYVNGKPNNMMSKNPSEVLKSMPANSIKRIEVITNPGPKYDAEGVGGILNIITVGKGLEGYTVTVSGNAGNRGSSAGTFATIKAGKLTVSANYNYSGYYNQDYLSGYTMTPLQTDNPSAAVIVSDNDMRSHGYFQQGSLEASYEIDTLRLVTASLSVFGGGARPDATTNTYATAPQTGNLLYKYMKSSGNRNRWTMLDASVDYQRAFSVKDRLLTLSYKISTSPEKEKIDNIYTEKNAEAEWQAFLDKMYDQHTDMFGNTLEQTFQLDYTTPFARLHTIETGAKYIMRNNYSNTDRYTRPSAAGDYAFDERNSSHFRHDNDILAAYFGYTLRVKRFSARTGLRYEHTFQNVRYLLGRGDDFKNQYDDFVPSASLGLQLNDFTSLRLAYNMRIFRPGIYSLNPYINDLDPSSISQGNPQLDTEKNHTMSFSFSHFKPRVSLNLALNYSFTNNSINSYTSLVNDNDIAGLENPSGKQVLYTTYKNIGSDRSVGLTGYLSWMITGTTRWYNNFGGYYMYFNDGSDMKNDGWYGSLYSGVEQTFKHDWRINLMFYGNTPAINLQGRSISYRMFGITVSKMFLNKRLTVSVTGNNFFQKYSPTYRSTVEAAGFRNESWNRWADARVSIGVSYRFGELTSGVKKTARTITNDDVKSNNSNKQGGQQ